MCGLVCPDFVPCKLVTIGPMRTGKSLQLYTCKFVCMINLSMQLSFHSYNSSYSFNIMNICMIIIVVAIYDFHCMHACVVIL